MRLRLLEMMSRMARGWKKPDSDEMLLPRSRLDSDDRIVIGLFSTVFVLSLACFVVDREDRKKINQYEKQMEDQGFKRIQIDSIRVEGHTTVTMIPSLPPMINHGSPKFLPVFEWRKENESGKIVIEKDKPPVDRYRRDH